MKFLAAAIAVAMVLAWPVAGEAQSRTSTAKSATPQKYASQRAKRAKVAVRRPAPCAARTWAGCLGWDPDPNVRSMIQMDAGLDDHP